MKLNSRAVNLRHLHDALAALNFAASTARTAPLRGTPPCPVRSDRAVLAAAHRAFQVGATPREIAGATLLPLQWARGAALNGAPGRTWARGVA